MTPRLAVIVLAYNQFELTRACLASVYQHAGAPLRVVVVDNASTDETPTRVRDFFPDAYVIENKTNRGYAQGNNVGLLYALDQNFEYAMLLNNDVTIAENCFAVLLRAADENQDAGLLGPIVYHAEEPRTIQSAGGVLPPDWHSYHRGANETEAGQFARVEDVDWLTGCAVLARVGALRAIGLLDENFFMYGEDVDWGVRARRAGYRVLFVPTARVWHRGVQRVYSPAPYVTYYSARNELQLIQKHRAGLSPLLGAWARNLRTVASWSLLPRWRAQRTQRDALVRALRDAAFGRTGQWV